MYLEIKRVVKLNCIFKIMVSVITLSDCNYLKVNRGSRGYTILI